MMKVVYDNEYLITQQITYYNYEITAQGCTADCNNIFVANSYLCWVIFVVLVIRMFFFINLFELVPLTTIYLF